MPIDADTEKRLRELATDAAERGDWYTPAVFKESQRIERWDVEFIAAANPAAIISLLDTVAELRRERDALREVIAWALGEGDDFPDWPESVTITWNPKFWWRKELRRRLDSALTKQQDAIRERNGENRPLGSTPDANTHG